MKINSLLLSMLAALSAGLCLTYASAYAQVTPEDQARQILQLFESGQKDSAYALLEPLKKSARFVPAVMYTRAQMTPDDRALGLYKEVIALSPGSQWAEKSAYQLVARYADKRDSLAAYTWGNVLKTTYSRSSLVTDADALLGGVKSWRAIDETADATGASRRPVARDPHAATGTASAARDSAARRPRTARPDSAAAHAGGKTTVKAGYALQVGLYPTKAEAQTHATALKQKKLSPVALPKVINGAKQYALVVGHYASVDEAQKSKAAISKSCGCSAFVVRVQ